MKEQLGRGLQFSHLSPGDVEDISSLCSGCIYWEMPEEFDKQPSPKETQRLKAEWLAARAPNRVLGKVARKEGKLVGYIQFGPSELYPQRLSYQSGPVSRDAMMITCLFVGSEYRRRGLGRRLLSLAEEAARQTGYSAIETFARRSSSDNPSGPIELYLECGFVVVKDDEFPLVRKGLQNT